eukprot:751301-Hanusia_phi.AAC.2
MKNVSEQPSPSEVYLYLNNGIDKQTSGEEQHSESYYEVFNQPWTSAEQRRREVQALCRIMAVQSQKLNLADIEKHSKVVQAKSNNFSKDIEDWQNKCELLCSSSSNNGSDTGRTSSSASMYSTTTTITHNSPSECGSPLLCSQDAKQRQYPICKPGIHVIAYVRTTVSSARPALQGQSLFSKLVGARRWTWQGPGCLEHRELSGCQCRTAVTVQRPGRAAPIRER